MEKEDFTAISLQDILNGSSPPSNPFYKFIIEQAKESEKFGRRVMLELHSSYQEYIKQQNENFQQLYSESFESKIKNRCKEKVKEQEHLIDSLKSYIEELKVAIINFLQTITETVRKSNEKTKRFIVKDYKDLKLGYNSDNGTECENLAADFELSKALESLNPKQGAKENHNKHRKKKSTISSSKDNENKRSLKQDEQLQDPPVYTITMSEIIIRYTSKVKDLQNQNQKGPISSSSNTSLDESSSKSSFVIAQREDVMQNLEELKQDDKLPNSPTYAVTIDTKVSQNLNDDNAKLAQLHAKILHIMTSGQKIRSKSFRFLKNPSIFKTLIQYSKSDNFNSLKKNIKNTINPIIYDILKKEFDRNDLNLSQNLEEYTKRGLIPKLPIGYKSYTEYEKQNIVFDLLTRKQKSRVRKLIVLEKSQILESG